MWLKPIFNLNRLEFKLNSKQFNRNSIKPSLLSLIRYREAGIGGRRQRGGHGHEDGVWGGGG
jgi:hypothetical protein